MPEIDSAARSAVKKAGAPVGLMLAIWLGGLIAGGALFGRVFIYASFKIPSGAMIPSVLVGDRIFANRVAYGFHIPFTGTVLGERLPERGDIIVFEHPSRHGMTLIKRVVGLPGDVIEVRNRRVILNGVPLATRDLQDERLTTEGDPADADYADTALDVTPFEETLGTHHHVALAMHMNRGSPMPSRRDGSWTVEAGHVFTLGDNRDNSEDSRFTRAEGGYGQVPVQNVTGRAGMIWLSIAEDRLRWERMFTQVP